MKTFKFNMAILLALLVVLSGCETVKHQDSVPKNVFDDLENKVVAAQTGKALSAPWVSTSSVPLRIVAPIYQTEFEKKSPATQALNKVVSFISQQPQQLDAMTGLPISTQFSSMTVSKFSLGEDEFSYVPAIFNVGYGDESALNAVFNVALMTQNSAEIGFYIDSQAWQADIVKLQGYKTIKTAGKQRNSVWFNYQLDLAGSDHKTKIDGLLKMTAYAIAADIRQFASINRDAVMKFNNQNYVVQRPNGDTFAYVYQDRIKAVEELVNAKIDALDKERVLNNTSNARSIHVDDSGSYITVNTLDNFISKVELLSLNNASQRTLVWESKQWDEYAKQAFYTPKLHKMVLLSDKQLTVHDLKTKQVEFELASELISSVSFDEASSLFYFIKADTGFVLDVSTNQVKPLTALGQLQTLAVTPGSKGLYALSSDNVLRYFDSENMRLNKVLSGVTMEGMRTCGVGRQLLYWQGTQAFIIDRLTRKQHEVTALSNFGDGINAGHCATTEAKFALMSSTGEIRQFNLTTREQLTTLLGDYDAYDKLNAGYQLNYLPNNEYIYGGKADLSIHKSTTIAEIKQDYDKQLSRVNTARSWLDKSSVNQVIFAEPLAQRELKLYKTLFAVEIKTETQRTAMLNFLNEEQADPLLAANKPSLFNRLSGGISVDSVDNVLLVKQMAIDDISLYTTSIPNWDHLGFKVSTVYLGSEGFEAKVYRRLNNSQLSGDIENIALPADTDMLVTTLSNGNVRLESLSAAFDFEDIFKAHENKVTAADISPDKRFLATAGSDGLIKIWLLTIPEQEHGWVTLDKALKGYASNVRHLEFIGDNLLLSSGSDQTIKVWDITSGRIAKNEMLGHTDKIRFAKYNDSLQQIVSASDDGSVRIWDVNEAEQVRSFKGTKQDFVVSYDQNSNMVAYSKNNKVLVKNVVNGNTLGRIVYTRAPVAVELGFSGDICYLIYPEKIAVYRVASGQLVSTIPMTNIKDIKQVLTNRSYQDLFIMTQDDIAVINTGRYALYGGTQNE